MISKKIFEILFTHVIPDCKILERIKIYLELVRISRELSGKSLLRANTVLHFLKTRVHDFGAIVRATAVVQNEIILLIRSASQVSTCDHTRYKLRGKLREESLEAEEPFGSFR